MAWHKHHLNFLQVTWGGTGVKNSTAVLMGVWRGRRNILVRSIEGNLCSMTCVIFSKYFQEIWDEIERLLCVRSWAVKWTNLLCGEEGKIFFVQRCEGKKWRCALAKFFDQIRADQALGEWELAVFEIFIFFDRLLRANEEGNRDRLILRRWVLLRVVFFLLTSMS